MKYIIMLLVIMGAIIILFVFPKENVSASPSPIHASPEMERNILAATFQLRIFNAEDTFYEEGIATLVRHHEQRLLLTHNHWSFLTSCSTVEFLNNKSQPLMTINCSALKYLIVFSDRGTLVLKAPESLGGTPAAMGSIQDALPGQSVLIVHQNTADHSKVSLTSGQIRSEDTFDKSPVLLLDVADEIFIKGDSGGGVWIDGKLVGNLWANIYERKNGPTFLWDFSEIPVAATTPTAVFPQETSISCIRSKNEEESKFCADMEAQILDVTIRIEMHYRESFEGPQKQLIKKSHATILDGKYLVTHNHFEYSLRRQVGAFGQQDGYTGISLRTTDGRLLLENAPLSTFRIVYDDRETLVLAFIDENGNGLFEAAGLPSGQFTDIGSTSLEVGDELAQIDWDGESAHVDWVRVDKLSLNSKVPQLLVNNYPKKGCSGGGVFWNDIHIGNTWGITIDKDPDTNETIRRYSTVALNSSEMLEEIQ